MESQNVMDFKKAEIMEYVCTGRFGAMREKRSILATIQKLWLSGLYKLC